MRNSNPADLQKLSEILIQIISELEFTEDLKLPGNIDGDLDYAYHLLRQVEIKLR